MMKRTILATIFMGLIFFSTDGHAAGPPPEKQTGYPGAAKDWTVRLGALAMHRPVYQGSDDYKGYALPMIDISWRDTIFLNSFKGLGAYFLDSGRARLGASIGWAFGRDESDSNDLTGLGDIDPGATANALFEWKSKDLIINARYQRQITGEETGFQVHTRLGYRFRLGKKTTLRPSVRTTFSSSEYMERHFSVSPAQSAGSGQPVYEAGAGLKSVGFQMMAIRRAGQRWGVQVMGGYTLLIGDAADSPLVKNEGQFTFGAGLSYMF